MEIFILTILNILYEDRGPFILINSLLIMKEWIFWTVKTIQHL